MKRRTKVIALALTVTALVPSIAFGWHFHGGLVKDPWRLAKNINDYTEQAKNAVATSQLYAAMALQLAEMAGVDIDNSNDKVVKAINRFIAYEPDLSEIEKLTKPLNYMEKDENGKLKEPNENGKYKAYVAMEDEVNKQYLEELKNDTSNDNVYQKAIDDITALQGKSNLSEWQKTNYAEALDIVKKSQRIHAMASKMKWIAEKDIILHAKKSEENAAQARNLTTPKADPFISNEKAAPDGTAEVDTVSYTSPTLGLTKF